nr:hypothetical protein [Sediminibacterium sp.]
PGGKLSHFELSGYQFDAAKPATPAPITIAFLVGIVLLMSFIYFVASTMHIPLEMQLKTSW